MRFNNLKLTIQDSSLKYNTLPQHQLELLLAHITGHDRLWVMTHRDYTLSAKQKEQLSVFCAQLIDGLPLAYIVGHRRFYDVDFYVDRHVLIPRQETEELVHHVWEEEQKVASEAGGRILGDIGTGSGCIGLTLARLLPRCQFVLFDKSKYALAIAKHNHQLQGSPRNVKFFQGDLIAPLMSAHIFPQVLIANLPYISETLYRELPVSVAKYEPRLALDGGHDGLVLYRKLLDQIDVLYHGKVYPELWWEISPEQVILIPPLFSHYKGADIQYIKDLNDRDRFVHITFR